VDADARAARPRTIVFTGSTSGEAINRGLPDFQRQWKGSGANVEIVSSFADRHDHDQVIRVPAHRAALARARRRQARRRPGRFRRELALYAFAGIVNRTPS
jgi:hypothetical protein